MEDSTPPTKKLKAANHSTETDDEIESKRVGKVLAIPPLSQARLLLVYSSGS